MFAVFAVFAVFFTFVFGVESSVFRDKEDTCNDVKCSREKPLCVPPLRKGHYIPSCNDVDFLCKSQKKIFYDFIDTVRLHPDVRVYDFEWPVVRVYKTYYDIWTPVSIGWNSDEPFQFLLRDYRGAVLLLTDLDIENCAVLHIASVFKVLLLTTTPSAVLSTMKTTTTTTTLPTTVKNKLARSGHTQDVNEKGKRRGEERRARERERERECVCV